MPDSRHHRGAHPQDGELFAPANLPALRGAVTDLSWLLGRGYAPEAAIKLVGDHFGLRERQRRAVVRASCPDRARADRAGRRVDTTGCGPALAIDGYNVLITLESALSGGLVFVGRDGVCRDLASVHGTYRKVEETLPALRLIIAHLRRCGIDQVQWLLDKPVSNSGRLKTLLAAELVNAYGDSEACSGWQIILADRPDAILAESALPVATADSVVLDRCRAWVDLAGELIRAAVPDAWVVDLRSPDDAPPG